MPFLIDGNNLIHALAEIDRSVERLGLCMMLRPLIDRGERVEVVFDGPPPPPGLAEQIDQTGAAVRYSPAAPADEDIIESLRAHSAPRRLVVVSSDREIRKAARARKCRWSSAENFARKLVDLQHAPPQAPPDEPLAKHAGLDEADRDFWYRKFGLDDEAGPAHNNAPD